MAIMENSFNCNDYPAVIVDAGARAETTETESFDLSDSDWFE